MTIEKIPHTARTGIIVGAVLLLAMLLCGQMRSNAQSGKSTSSLACVQRASFRQEPEFWISWRPSEGAKPIRLLKGTEPALSPDGKTLACVVDMTVNPGADDQALILVNLKTQKKLEILRPRTWIRCPRWSPHGDRLAVILWDKKQSQRYLCVLQADGSGLKEIAREGRGG
ncbi:MAG: PD40 domain-containing protein, partial [Armatimonadetes bacterium]|nr:PD40 domain-containing protein [Armatimonadota bacterium]